MSIFLAHSQRTKSICLLRRTAADASDKIICDAQRRLVESTCLRLDYFHVQLLRERELSLGQAQQLAGEEIHMKEELKVECASCVHHAMSK